MKVPAWDCAESQASPGYPSQICVFLHIAYDERKRYALLQKMRTRPIDGAMFDPVMRNDEVLVFTKYNMDCI